MSEGQEWQWVFAADLQERSLCRRVKSNDRRGQDVAIVQRHGDCGGRFDVEIRGQDKTTGRNQEPAPVRGL